jgi:hypothetical protein
LLEKNKKEREKCYMPLTAYRTACTHPPGVPNKVSLLEELNEVWGEAISRPTLQGKTKQSSLGPKLALQCNPTVSRNDFASSNLKFVEKGLLVLFVDNIMNISSQTF